MCWMTPCWSAERSLDPGAVRAGARAAVKTRSMDDQRIVGLVATSSPDFVARAFASWQAGLGIVTLRTSDDRERLSVAGGREVIVPEPGHGWLDVRHEPKDSDAV